MLPIWEKFTKCNKMNWGGYNLVILGDGPLRKDVELYIRNHNLSNIRIDAPTSDVAKYYEEFEILVMTSIFEGFGLVLTEAMSKGCVPIAFDSFSSVRDIICSSYNGILVSPFNQSEYVDKLVQLTKSPQLFKKMSEAAKSTIEKFDINVIGCKWIALFDDLSDRC